jgi:hypothetical protein
MSTVSGVKVQALRWADPPSKDSYRIFKKVTVSESAPTRSLIRDGLRSLEYPAC